MGIIIGKFTKKISTYDVLEKLDNEITSIEGFQKETQQTQRKIIFWFILLAVLIYAVLLFILYSQIPPNQKVLWSVPLVLFPVLIWVIKRFLSWYFSRKLKRNEKKLVMLKEKKKQILENVMETETYKVAKRILDKFGNETVKPLVATPKAITPMVRNTRSQPYSLAYGSGLRQRNLLTQNYIQGRRSLDGVPQTPYPSSQLALPSPQLTLSSPVTRMPENIGDTPMTVSRITAARTILPKERSVLDKIIDYLVADGPANRYALICHQCSGHNGMALKEEFEYISFRCCYCGQFNPSRKKKPVGPTFSITQSLPSEPSNAESSDSERNSETDSDSDSRPVISEIQSTLSGSDQISATETAESQPVEKTDSSSPISNLENAGNSAVMGDFESNVLETAINDNNTLDNNLEET